MSKTSDFLILDNSSENDQQLFRYEIEKYVSEIPNTIIMARREFDRLVLSAFYDACTNFPYLPINFY